MDKNKYVRVCKLMCRDVGLFGIHVVAYVSSVNTVVVAYNLASVPDV